MGLPKKGSFYLIEHRTSPVAIDAACKGERISMPKLTVEGVGSFDVTAGKRLVLALEDEAGIDQLHACGGYSACTTCQVTFTEGEPEKMTAAEKETLSSRGLSGVRLSCQIYCDHDMTIRAESRVEGSGRTDAGPRPDDGIQPEPVEWTDG
jgi:ferredoxin